jgi:hypothetical protein
MNRMAAVLIISLVCTPSALFGWGNATHVYYADELGRQHGGQNFHEMYGSVLVDAFNLKLDSLGVFMADRAHHDFIPLYNSAWRCDLKDIAFGFVSHNDTWGSDYTAHHVARTVSGGGYAVVKGAELAPMLIPDIVTILVTAGLDTPSARYIAGALAPEFGHDLVETAVDLMIKRNLDPAIGRKIVLAATTRPLDTPLLLAAAYARPLSQHSHMTLLKATKYIMDAERENRQQIIQYGSLFTITEAEAIQGLAMMNAAIAQGYLEFYAGVPVTVDPAVVVGFITNAMSVVEPTYDAEVSATLDYVRHEMQVHGIRSCGSHFGKENAGDQDGNSTETPATVALEENYPNPFNPSTTIKYDLPTDEHVSLKVYDALGREVRTLVDGFVKAGYQQVSFDASEFASGVYFYRLQVGDFVSMKKMMLMK